MEDQLVNVSVVVKGFDSKEPTFRCRAYGDILALDASKEMLPRDEGDIGLGGYIKLPPGASTPYGQLVYGLAIGKADAYPCISLAVDEQQILKELDWWRENYGFPYIARFMRPAVLEAPPALGPSGASLLALARESQAPEGGEGFYASWPRSPKWRAVRDAFLKENPTCAGCGDTRMLNVHHKMPFHLFPDLELAPVNLITLCEVPSHACHFALGHCFDWRAYNPYVEEDAKARLARVAKREY